MSGRGRASRGGRGGRFGKFSQKSSKSSSNTTAKRKKTIEDYFYYVGSAKQASDYNLTTEQVINHIKKEYDRGVDIAEALRTGQNPDMTAWQPTLAVSADPDVATKAREDEQNKMVYKAELDEYMKRKRVYEDNKVKAYAFIWDRCAKAMQAKLMARSDYESRIYNNPLESCTSRFESTL